MERFVISNKDNTFDVIEGRQLNDEPLSRAAADRLAKGSPVSAAPPSPPTGAKAPPPGAKAPVLAPKRKPATNVTVEPQPAPAVDLRTTRANNAGGSAGFTIRGR